MEFFDVIIDFIQNAPSYLMWIFEPLPELGNVPPVAYIFGGGLLVIFTCHVIKLFIPIA